MLPPFVPPSARAATETLPLITDFVLKREPRTPPMQWGDRVPADVATDTMTEPLPPITHFLAMPADVPHVGATPIVDDDAPPEDAAKAQDSASPVEGKWIEEERNSFDWQSVAVLAIRQNEDRRAEDEWATTNWDGAHSAADQVASLLTQAARRVRAGELKVDATRGMSVEAALAATLAALLRNDN